MCTYILMLYNRYCKFDTLSYDHTTLLRLSKALLIFCPLDFFPRLKPHTSNCFHFPSSLL